MENPFALDYQEAPEQKSQLQFVLEEMEAESPRFSDSTRQTIKKKLGRVEKVSLQEWTDFKNEMNAWWQERYGFPYTDTEARHAFFRKLNLPQPKRTDATALQWELLDALKADDQAKIKELQDIFYAEFPDQLQAVTVLFEMRPFLELSTKVAEDPEYYFTHEEFYEYLTQYQFLLTNFVIQNSQDEEFMEHFWRIFRVIAEDAGRLMSYRYNKRGILSQVAVFKIFEKLGMAPTLSHPREDAFKSIDLWTEGGSAIQIKSSKDPNDVLCMKTDEISFPGVRIQYKDKTSYFNTNIMQKAQRFLVRLNDYNKLTEEDVTGYFIVIPESRYNQTTGEPDPEMVGLIKKELQIEA